MYRAQAIDSQLLSLSTQDAASGSIATFTTDMQENLVECVCEVASGNSAVNISACGVNVFEGQIIGGYYWGGNVGDVISKTAHSGRACNTNLMPVKPNTTYWFSGSIQTGANYYWWYCDKAQKILNSSGSWKGGGETFTTPADCYYFAFTLSFNYAPTDISINYPSTDTTRHAYNGNTYNIQLGETLTDTATYNAVTGVLTRNDTTTKQLDSCPIVTLDNEVNNIWSDTGDTSVKFILSVGEYVNQNV